VFNEMTGASDWLANRLVDNSINSTESINTQATAFVALRDAYLNNEIGAEDLTQAVDVLNLKYGGSISAATLMRPPIVAIGTAMEEVAGKVRGFAGMVGKTLKQWVTDTKESMSDAILSLGGLSKATAQTAGDMRKSFHQMMVNAAAAADAVRKFDADPDMAPNFKQFMNEQGPQAIMNFERSNHEQQLKMQREWRSTSDSVATVERSTNRLARNSSINTATKQVKELHRQVDSLRGVSNIKVAVTAYGLPDWSKMPKAASGGFVASSGMAVIHRGETVTPAGRAAAVGTQDNSRFELVLDSGERLTGLMRRIASQEAAAQSLADRRVGAMR